MKTNLNKKLADFSVLPCTVKESKVGNHIRIRNSGKYKFCFRLTESPSVHLITLSRRHTKNEVCTHMQGRKQTPYVFYI